MAEVHRFVTARNTVCSIQEAREAVQAGKAKFIDARWYLPNDPRDARSAYMEGHLPGAVFLDIDAVSTPSEGHPHLMPSPEVFAKWLGEHGISRDDALIVYDDTGFFSAPRGWWMARSIGHAQVRVLDGGMNAWVAEGLPVERGEADVAAADYGSDPDAAALVASREDVKKALQAQDLKVVDARPEGRFTGVAPEPRPGLSSGHMPGAINVPAGSLVDAEGRLLPAPELEKKLSSRGLEKTDNVIASCGSGITACVPLLAMAEIGWQGRLRLYDGSWIDWASRPDAEIAKVL